MSEQSPRPCVTPTVHMVHNLVSEGHGVITSAIKTARLYKHHDLPTDRYSHPIKHAVFTSALPLTTLLLYEGTRQVLNGYGMHLPGIEDVAPATGLMCVSGSGGDASYEDDYSPPPRSGRSSSDPLANYHQNFSGGSVWREGDQVIMYDESGVPFGSKPWNDFVREAGEDDRRLTDALRREFNEERKAAENYRDDEIPPGASEW